MGAPPSARDEVDMAPSNSIVANTKRITFFMRNLRGINATGNHHIFFAGRNAKCSKSARWKAGARRSTDNGNRAPARFELGVDDAPALVSPVSIAVSERSSSAVDQVPGGDCFVGQPTEVASSQPGTPEKVCWLLVFSRSL